jgi:ABC-type multidrug transport system fused ATPase/permease subunit
LAAVFVPLLIAYFYVLRYVRHFAIEMQRLEANARSPLYASFSEVLAGLVTVRAYGEQDRFQYEQMKKLNDHIQPYFVRCGCGCGWLLWLIVTSSSSSSSPSSISSSNCIILFALCRWYEQH